MNTKGNCECCNNAFDYDDKQQTGKSCSIKCSKIMQYREYIENWKSGTEMGGVGFLISRHVRRYLHECLGSKCSLCGWGETNTTTEKVPLHIDHINGDSTNHTESNLRLICPNCHSLTENYGSLNRGNGRYKKAETLHIKYK